MAGTPSLPRAVKLLSDRLDIIEEKGITDDERGEMVAIYNLHDRFAKLAGVNPAPVREATAAEAVAMGETAIISEDGLRELLNPPGELDAIADVPDETVPRPAVRLSRIERDDAGYIIGGFITAKGLTFYIEPTPRGPGDSRSKPTAGSIEELIGAAIGLLVEYQDSPLGCAENADALHYLGMAEIAMERRRADRIERGVEGTREA